MKYLIYIFALFTIALKLDAVETLEARLKGLPAEDQLSILDKEIRQNNRNKNARDRLSLINESRIPKYQDCTHCPSHLTLSGQINKVLEEMQKDLESDKSSEKSEEAVILPARLNRMKFLYYNELITKMDGSVACNQIMPDTATSGPVKISGQLELVAEDVFIFPAVSEAQFDNPNLKAVTYYYRGEGDKSHIIIEAVMARDGGGTFRYYNYTPDAQEVMPNDSTDVRVDFSVVEKRKSIKVPRNYHLVRVRKSHDVSESVQLEASADTSLKGQKAQLDFVDKFSGDSYAIIDLEARTNGRKEARVIVPYQVPVVDSVSVEGRVQKGSKHDIVSASIVDSNAEVVRVVYSKDRAKDEESYVIARDMAVGESVASFEVGKSTTEKKGFVGVKYITPLSKKITAVLEVRAGTKEKMIVYQVQSNF